MGDDDHTPSNAGYHGGADERQPQPNLQLPKDYWGAEGTFDENGHWHGGTIHNPIHDVPSPGSLDPSQVLPHQQGPAGPTMMALSHDQVSHLHSARQQLSEALSLLEYSATTAEVVQNLPTVLTIANSAVQLDGTWEHNLADACRTWIATEPGAGTDDQFHHARDEVVRAGYALFAEIDQWLHQNDQIMFATQGNIALQQLAHVAATAHQGLHAPTP
jgi:hypothetical protein